MLKINPNPTFKSAISIPVPGGPAVGITGEFRHMGKKALADYIKSAETRDDLDLIGQILVGWDGVDAPFDAASLAQILDAYPLAAKAMLEAYLAEIAKASEKN